MQAGVILSSPGDFMQLMTKPLQPMALASSPVCRYFPDDHILPLQNQGIVVA
jgi:hypothetical protein